MAERTDEQLYVAVQAGDDAALAELVERYQAPLHRFLYRYTNDAMLADDFVQEAFMRLLGHTGKPPQYFRAWVYRIARNLAYDHFRSAGYRRETNADEITQTAPTNPEQQVMQQDNQQVIADALQQLTPDHREVVLLRFYDAMRLSEIAAVVGVPEGTVKSRLYHALKRLKGLLAKDFSALEEAR